MIKFLHRFVTGSCFLILPLAARAVVIGQTDTFEDGTTAGWHVPGESLTPPSNIATGGPAGAGDNYLRLISGGPGGPGSRLSVHSGSQWSGNYLAAGIGQIVMNVNNTGPTDVHLRLLFEDFSAVPNTPPSNLALSANATIVPAGSGWMRIAFDVSPSGLISNVFGTVNGALTSTHVVRLLHNPAPFFPGPPIGSPIITAQLGIDNIQAVGRAVPEYSSSAGLLLCVSLCFGAILGLKRRFPFAR